MEGLGFGNFVHFVLYKHMEVISKISKYRGVQGIYAIINVNKLSPRCPYGTPYVGQTKSKPTAKKHRLGIGHRLGDHRCKLRKGVHHNPRLQNAWNKYGETSFVFFLVERVDDPELLTEKEQFWMDEWDSYHQGYNARPIADSSIGHRRRTDLTSVMLRKWVELYFEEHGVYPTCHSGRVHYAENEPISWHGVDQCLVNGFRGQPPGQSLSKFIANEFGVLNGSNYREYTESQILEWAERFYDENGYYPTKRSGEFTYGVQSGYCATTWSAIDACLVKGNRGLSGNNSLSALIRDKAKRKVKYRSWYRGTEEG